MVLFVAPKRIVIAFLVSLVMTSVCVAHGTSASDRQSVRKIAETIRKAQPRAKRSLVWARAIHKALTDQNHPLSQENICSVIAIIDQESNFKSNPSVAGLSRISTKEFNRKRQQFPYDWFFRAYPEIEQGLYGRIRKSKTERDLDNATRYAFDTVLDTWNVGNLIDWVLPQRSLSDLFEGINSIKTVGSMQVSVQFARLMAFGTDNDSLQDTYKLRDYLYTIEGGVWYGTAQLLGYATPYKRKIHRFADYNAGRYASRNAAFQALIAELAGQPLKTDGDLLIYDPNRRPKFIISNTETVMREVAKRYRLNLSDAQIRKDFMEGRTRDFEYTHTFLRTRKAYRNKRGHDYAIAEIPNIKLKSSKLSRGWTTERFAKKVEGRYRNCLRIWRS